MPKNIPSFLIDNIILLMRKNINKFEYDFNEISSQLETIQNMRLAKIADKYILQSLVEKNSIIIQNIKKLRNGSNAKEIKELIEEFERELNQK